MERREFAEKLREVLKKLGECSGTDYDYLVVSEDPDCIADFGVDDKDRIVIIEKSTFLSVAELESIRYRGNSDECEDGDGYLLFVFKNDVTLRIDFPFIYDTKKSYKLTYKKMYFDEEAYKLLTSVNDGWRWEGDFIITNDATLLAYVGEEKEVIVPEGVVRIYKSAFKGNEYIERLVLADTVKIIDSGAFVYMRKLRSIDLKNVEVIEDYAFMLTYLRNLTLPSTLKKLGKNVFYHALCPRECIDNQSDLEITDEMFAWREDFVDEDES